MLTLLVILCFWLVFDRYKYYTYFVISWRFFAAEKNLTKDILNFVLKINRTWVLYSCNVNSTLNKKVYNWPRHLSWLSSDENLELLKKMKIVMTNRRIIIIAVIEDVGGCVFQPKDPCHEHQELIHICSKGLQVVTKFSIVMKSIPKPNHPNGSVLTVQKSQDQKTQSAPNVRVLLNIFFDYNDVVYRELFPESLLLVSKTHERTTICHNWQGNDSILKELKPISKKASKIGAFEKLPAQVHYIWEGLL